MLVKCCRRDWKKARLYLSNQGRSPPTHRLCFDGFWASYSNLVTCIPDLGMFSNKMAMMEALRLSFLCPSFPFLTFPFFHFMQRFCEFVVSVFQELMNIERNLRAFAHAGGLEGSEFETLRALQRAHCFCSACKKWSSTVLFVYFV